MRNTTDIAVAKQVFRCDKDDTYKFLVSQGFDPQQIPKRIQPNWATSGYKHHRPRRDTVQLAGGHSVAMSDRGKGQSNMAAYLDRERSDERPQIRPRTPSIVRPSILEPSGPSAPHTWPGDVRRIPLIMPSPFAVVPLVAESSRPVIHIKMPGHARVVEGTMPVVAEPADPFRPPCPAEGAPPREHDRSPTPKHEARRSRSRSRRARKIAREQLRHPDTDPHLRIAAAAAIAIDARRREQRLRRHLEEIDSEDLDYIPTEIGDSSPARSVGNLGRRTSMFVTNWNLRDNSWNLRNKEVRQETGSGT